MHKSITIDRVIAVLEAAQGTLLDPGFCHACGAEAGGVEPDAREYPCEECPEDAVFGAEETLLEIA